MFSTLLLGLSLAAAPVSGAMTTKKTCGESETRSAHGRISKRLKELDRLLARMSEAKNPTKELNRFIERHGLLFIAAGTEKTAPKDRVEEDSEMSDGKNYFIFLKRLKPGPGYALDELYEFKTLDGKKPLRRWFLPSNSPRPLGFSGEDLVFRFVLFNPCNFETNRTVFLKVSTDGRFRAIDEFAEQSATSPESCGAKAIYKKSAYGTCSLITDDKGKKRVLVYEQPIT